MPTATPTPADPRTRSRRTEAVLLAGYVLVLVAALFSVVIPELSKEPEAEGTHPPAAEPTPTMPAAK